MLKLEFYTMSFCKVFDKRVSEIKKNADVEILMNKYLYIIYDTVLIYDTLCERSFTVTS